MKLAHIFFNIDMRNGHDGLATILKKKAGVDVLPHGETAIFINNSWSALKLMTSGDILLHLKRPYHKPINPETIKYLPNCVEGGELNYTRALETVLSKKFKATVKEFHHPAKYLERQPDAAQAFH